MAGLKIGAKNEDRSLASILLTIQIDNFLSYKMIYFGCGSALDPILRKRKQLWIPSRVNAPSKSGDLIWISSPVNRASGLTQSEVAAYLQRTLSETMGGCTPDLSFIAAILFFVENEIICYDGGASVRGLGSA